jgi:hypothetical protein
VLIAVIFIFKKWFGKGYLTSIFFKSHVLCSVCGIVVGLIKIVELLLNCRSRRRTHFCNLSIQFEKLYSFATNCVFDQSHKFFFHFDFLLLNILLLFQVSFLFLLLFYQLGLSRLFLPMFFKYCRLAFNSLGLLPIHSRIYTVYCVGSTLGK